MTQLKVDTIVNAVGTGAADLEDGFTINGDSSGALNLAQYYSGAEPGSPANGAIWWDSDNEASKIYVNSGWYTINMNASASASVTPWYGARALFAGGYQTALRNNIDYISIATSENATDFGDLVAASNGQGGVSNGSRAVFFLSNSTTNYVTTSTAANASSFGTVSALTYGAACSDGSKGLVIGFGTTAIEKITIATLGNATSFSGTLSYSANYGPAAAGDSTRALFSGGTTSEVNTIEYVTYQTESNSTDFGDMTAGKRYHKATEDTTRVVYGGGLVSGANTNILDYVTTQTPGNATDFGDLTISRTSTGAATDATYGIYAGGYTTTRVNTIDKITIQTTGNASDHGDLTSTRQNVSGASGAAA